ncbi:regulator of cell cycle RGCC-like [Protopterus annectens]|uniref:regulator of cell cycle RGCC-like n=1 Tax=Protopterus annectens TaxID=7888 RepID=UPI001CF956E7|nr:regulator of cell cycle RGCC-like [Protopterus annectens]
MASERLQSTVCQEEDFDALLKEFDVVLEDFQSPFDQKQMQYEQHLQEMKLLVTNSNKFIDSEESDSGNSSPGSSLNCSEENLNVPPVTKAKLGDTKDLEDFIADLDKELAEM